MGVTSGERDWTGAVSGVNEEEIARLKGLPGVQNIEVAHMPLEDIFCALVGGES